MTPAARLAAAIEVLAELAARPRPAADVQGIAAISMELPVRQIARRLTRYGAL